MVVVVSAAEAVALLLVVRGLRQAASQRTAAAVAKRAREEAIAEGDDAALEHAEGAIPWQGNPGDRNWFHQWGQVS